MAETKGLLVEIGADTSKMNKALNRLNAPLKKIQSELKFIDKALKLNPKNVELLRQKFKLMQDAIRQSESNTTRLKAELARLKANNAPAEQIRRLEREIVLAEAETKKLRKEFALFKASQSTIGKLGTSMTALGGKITNVGNKLRGVSMMTSLIGGIAVRTTAEFDGAMSKVQAISGATGNEFAKLRDKAREMGAKTKFSATESAEALSYMAMAGWKTKDMLSGLEGIMNLAAASGEDLSTTSDIVTDALTAFGLSAKESGRFADVLAAASSNANTNVSMMGETFKFAAPVAGALGYNVEDTALAIGLMANSGIKATQAGTSLRSMMSRLASPTAQVQESMEKLGVEIKNADGSARPLRDVILDLRSSMAKLSATEKTQIASSIAGKNAMSGFLAIVNSSDADFNKLADAIDNSDGAALKMADIMQDNLGGQLTILKSQLQELSIAMGDTLTPIVKKAVAVLQLLVDKFNSLPDNTKRIITLFLGLVAVSGPLLLVVGAMTSAFGAISTAASKLPIILGKIFGTLGIGAGTVTRFLGPIGLAVSAFSLLWKNSEEFRDAVKQLVDVLGGSLMQIFNAMKPLLPVIATLLSQVATVVGTVLGGAIKAVIPLITKMLAVFTAVSTSILGIVNKLASGISSGFNAIKQKMVNPINSARDTIKKAVNKIKSFFPLKIGKIFSNLKLPHFSISGGKAPFGIGGKGSKPSISVKWYKTGGIFDGTTVQALGWGEKAPEAIIPLSGREMQPFAAAIADNFSNIIDYGQLANAIIAGLAGASAPIVLQIDGKTVADTTAPYMNVAINTIQARQARQLGFVGA